MVPVTAVGKMGVPEKGTGSLKVSNMLGAQISKSVFACIFSFLLTLCDSDMEEILVLLWRKMVTCTVFHCYRSLIPQELIESLTSTRHYAKPWGCNSSCPRGASSLVREIVSKGVHTGLCSIAVLGFTSPLHIDVWNEIILFFKVNWFYFFIIYYWSIDNLQ